MKLQWSGAVRRVEGGTCGMVTSIGLGSAGTVIRVGDASPALRHPGGALSPGPTVTVRTIGEAPAPSRPNGRFRT